MTTLTLIPMPLGDPDDITLRALRLLREARVIAADDLPAAQSRLEHYAVTAPLIPYADTLAALTAGDVVLIAAAGTPGIGDAAHEIVQSAIVRGVRIEPLPGANAEITALVLSGLPTDAFVYVGTIPDDLSAYAHERDTLIFTVDDLPAALDRLLAAFGDRAVCLAVALTRPDEIVYRGSLRAASTQIVGVHGRAPLHLIVAGAPPEQAITWNEDQVRAALRERLAAGEPLKLAAKSVAAAAGCDRRTVYALGVAEKGG
jgi:16S rRNA (cytidine1402-2'-O)-methyltransferase